MLCVYLVILLTTIDHQKGRDVNGKVDLNFTDLLGIFISVVPVVWWTGDVATRPPHNCLHIMTTLY